MTDVKPNAGDLYLMPLGVNNSSVGVQLIVANVWEAMELPLTLLSSYILNHQNMPRSTRYLLVTRSVDFLKASLPDRQETNQCECNDCNGNRY